MTPPAGSAAAAATEVWQHVCVCARARATPFCGGVACLWRILTRVLAAAVAMAARGCQTVNLFGTSMTFLMSSEGHADFFASKKEHVYDIREAYKCTVVTFGPFE